MFPHTCQTPAGKAGHDHRQKDHNHRAFGQPSSHSVPRQGPRRPEAESSDGPPASCSHVLCTPGVRDGPWGSHTSPEPLSQLHGRENRASGRLLTTIITLIMATLCPQRQQREEPDAGQERPAKRERQDRKVKERPSYQTDKTLLKEPQLQLDPEHVPNTNLLGPKARMTPWSDGHVPTCFTPHSRWPLTPPSSHPRPRHLRTAGQGLKSRPP